MILFTADWHIKLGQKNVPREWAIDRYQKFFEQVHSLEKQCNMHIIGGDLFDSSSFKKFIPRMLFLRAIMPMWCSMLHSLIDCI